jgi:hypothetical protein
LYRLPPEFDVSMSFSLRRKSRVVVTGVALMIEGSKVDSRCRRTSILLDLGHSPDKNNI